jgi:hypothetical protein
MKFLNTLIIFTLFAFANLTLAKDHFLLNERGELKAKYIKSKPFEDGDRLIFSDEHIFEYQGELGRGNTTAVLRVRLPGESASFALRIPQTSHFKKNVADLIDYLNDYIEGYKVLRNSQMRTAVIVDSREFQFVLTAVENIDFSLSDLFNPMSSIDSALKKEAKEKLVDFIKSSVEFQEIGDFHFDQLVYSREEKQWKLIDWNSSHFRARSPISDHFINLRLAISELRASTHIYEDLYGHPMPMAMFDRMREEYEDFFSELNLLIERERAELVEKEKIILDRLKLNENISDQLKGLPYFRMAEARARLKEIIFTKKNDIDLSFSEYLELLRKAKKLTKDEFLFLAEKLFTQISSLEELAEISRMFSYLELSNAEKQSLDNMFARIFSQESLEGLEHSSHVLLQIAHSSLVTDTQKQKIWQLLGTNRFSLRSCLMGLKNLLK